MEIALLNYFVLNDELKSTCDFNPAPLHTGTLVYEVIRIIDGKPLFFREHLDRFFRSAENCGLKVHLTEKEIALRIRNLIQYNKMLQGNIEFVCHFDEKGKRNFLAWCTPWKYPTQEQYKTGVKVTSLKAERIKPGIKAFNRRLREESDRIIAKKKVYEVVLVNSKGIITEGSRSNLFFIKNDTLFTPPVSLVLPGVTRSRIFALCRENRIEVNETDIHLKETANYESMFISGTSPKILPVKNFDETEYSVNNQLMRYLMKELDRIIAEDIKRFDFDMLF